MTSPTLTVTLFPSLSMIGTCFGESSPFFLDSNNSAPSKSSASTKISTIFPFSLYISFNFAIVTTSV
ncbi:hypothetical protein [Methanobrevibacter filiformis]|uniref:hypothetical protein n=1 Tax=Methanobrevibacter filiformis TaxID=55758 RepID=UPI001FE0B70D|nr:hypothetical protein [Methanobrevibacter filiformis]